MESTKKEKRLKILSIDEIESIYNRPRFTDEERIEYFCLSQSEQELLELFRSIKSQVYFIIQLGSGVWTKGVKEGSQQRS